MICRVFLASNVKSSQDATERSPGQDADVETLPIEIEVERVQKSDSGLICVTIKTVLIHKASGFWYQNIFIVQVCSVDGMLSL